MTTSNRGPRAPKTVPSSQETAAKETPSADYINGVDDESNGETDSTGSKEYVAKEFSPRDIRGFNGTLWVRNNTATTVSWSTLGKDSAPLRLEQAGTDGSISVLLPEVANHPAFQKFWRKGKVTVTDDPEMEIQLEKYSIDEVEVERLQSINTQAQIIQTQQKAIPMPKLGIFADGFTK